MKTVAIATVPHTYKAPVNWYVAQDDTAQPIHCFTNKPEAVEFARSLPPRIITYHWTNETTTMPHQVDWFPADSNPRETVSNRREIIDHRN